MRPTAKSLVLDLLSTARRGAIPVSALVAAGDLFGLAENNVRVALARLVARRLVARDERGAYRLAPAAAAVQDQVSSWRRIEERVRPWRGGWVGVHTAGLPRRRGAVRRRTRALAYLGFRELAPGLHVRPDNLAGGVTAVRERLRGLGLEPAAPVFALAELDEASDAQARRLWDGAALGRRYRALGAALAASGRRLARLDQRTARVESFLLGGRVIRQLALDPLLPEPIVAVAERRALVDAMLRYDRLGRACWSGALEHRGVAHERAPADLRMFATGRLAPAEVQHV